MDSDSVKPTKLGSLEIGRFIAASIVMLGHLGPIVAKYGNVPADSVLNTFIHGAFAIQYFFVLSGFVMATAHGNDFGRIHAIPKFLWRRACRIYPLYWLAVLIPFYFQIKNISPLMAFHFLFLPPIPVSSELLPPAWTLQFEVAFYLVFSLCLLPYAGRPILVLWIITVFWINDSFAEHQHFLPSAPHWMFTLRQTWWTMDFVSRPTCFFISGVAAGFLFLKLTPSKTQCSVAVIFSSIALIATWKTSHGASIDQSNYVGLLAVPAVAALILSLALAEKNGLLHIGKFGSALGAISYPIYILHWALFLIYDHYFGTIRFGERGLCVLYVSGLIVIYGVSIFVTFTFDKPVQKILRRVYH